MGEGTASDPIAEALECADNGLPDVLRPLIAEVLREIGQLEARVKDTERALEQLTREDRVVQRMREASGPYTGFRVRVARVEAVRDFGVKLS